MIIVIIITTRTLAIIIIIIIIMIIIITMVITIIIMCSLLFDIHALHLIKPGPNFELKDGNLLDFEDVDVAWDIVGVSFQPFLLKF